MTIPDDILDIIKKLPEVSDQDTLKNFIYKLQGEEPPKESAATAEDAAAEAAEDDHGDEPPFPPVYESGDDFEKAGEFKMQAADLKSEGKWDEALEKYTQAIQCAEPSSLLYANRAMALLKLDRPRAAERDGTLALKMNPDSAKALRVRGKARKVLGKYEAALKDLSQSQQIDFDEDAAEDLKELTKLHIEREKEEAHKRVEEEEKKRKRAEEIKKAQDDAKQEAAEERARNAAAGMGGMPDMSGMGGMPGMGGGGGAGMGGMNNIMQMLMSDPELAAGMQNPKVMSAFSSLLNEPGGVGGLMANPAKLQELMSDPEVGPFMKKLMAKLGPAMGGGMPNMGGGSSGGAPPTNDDIDLSDLPDLE